MSRMHGDECGHGVPLSQRARDVRHVREEDARVERGVQVSDVSGAVVAERDRLADGLEDNGGAAAAENNVPVPVARMQRAGPPVQYRAPRGPLPAWPGRTVPGGRMPLAGRASPVVRAREPTAPRGRRRGGEFAYAQ